MARRAARAATEDAYHARMQRRDVSHPLETLWQAPAITWTILAGECLALVLSLSPGVAGSRLVLFGLASFLIQWVALLTLGTLYLLRGTVGKLRPQHVAWLGLLLLLVWTWAVAGLARVLFGAAIFGAHPNDWLWSMVLVTGIVLTVGMLGLAALHNHWQAQQSAIRAQQAELRALQARTHPHFLFNTLNTGAALVHTRPDAAETLLLDLADLFRAALTGPRYTSLAQEIDLTRRYLSIEQLRLADRLKVRWEVPTPLPEASVPALSLQPLVENAIRHGVERMPRGGTVDILVTTATGRLLMTVRNDTPGPDARNKNQGHGIGLASVEHRIDEMTAGQGAVHTTLKDGRHVATIRIPLDSPRPG